MADNDTVGNQNEIAQDLKEVERVNYAKLQQEAKEINAGKHASQQEKKESGMGLPTPSDMGVESKYTNALSGPMSYWEKLGHEKAEKKPAKKERKSVFLAAPASNILTGEKIAKKKPVVETAESLMRNGGKYGHTTGKAGKEIDAARFYQTHRTSNSIVQGILKNDATAKEAIDQVNVSDVKDRLENMNPETQKMFAGRLAAPEEKDDVMAGKPLFKAPDMPKPPWMQAPKPPTGAGGRKEDH